MRFQNYYPSLTMKQKNNLAKQLDTSTHYLYLIATGRRNPGRKYVLDIPSLTRGVVKADEIIYVEE